MKRNIDDFNNMRDFIISIVTVTAWVLIGSIIIVGYFTIDTKGESIMLSFISTIFTIISSLGILATITVYFWQKKDTKENNENIRRSKLLAYTDIYLQEKKKYRLVYKQFIIISKRLSKEKNLGLRIRRRGDIFIFLLDYKEKRDRKYSFHFNENDLISLREISLKLIDIDINTHKKAKNVIFAYSQLYTRLDNLFIIFASNTTKTVRIKDVQRFARKNNFKVNEIYNLAFKNSSQ